MVLCLEKKIWNCNSFSHYFITLCSALGFHVIMKQFFFVFYFFDFNIKLGKITALKYSIKSMNFMFLIN